MATASDSKEEEHQEIVSPIVAAIFRPVHMFVALFWCAASLFFVRGYVNYVLLESPQSATISSGSTSFGIEFSCDRWLSFWWPWNHHTWSEWLLQFADPTFYFYTFAHLIPLVFVGYCTFVAILHLKRVRSPTGSFMKNITSLPVGFVLGAAAIAFCEYAEPFANAVMSPPFFGQFAKVLVIVVCWFLFLLGIWMAAIVHYVAVVLFTLGDFVLPEVVSGWCATFAAGLLFYVAFVSAITDRPGPFRGVRTSEAEKGSGKGVRIL